MNPQAVSCSCFGFVSAPLVSPRTSRFVIQAKSEPSEKSVEIMRKFSEQYARRSGTYFCVDKGVTSVVIKGLAEHKDSYGAPLCPCRHYDDKAAEVGQGFWNCPCVPMRERKECHCMLFLTPDNDFAGKDQTITSDEIKETTAHITLSIEHDGAPFGNVVSYSDGLPGKGKGVPYFYLTMLDPTTRNALKDSRASFAISESPIGTCKRDPMDPTCSKLTLTGKLLQLDEGSEEDKEAKKALFTKHPEMMDWPEGHEFSVFKLEIMNIFLINWYGGAKSITVDEYLRYKETKVASFL